MPAVPLRQRSSTELVDAAFQVFRREPLQFIAGIGLVYVPVFVIGLLSGDLLNTSDDLSFSGWMSLLGGLATIFAYAVGNGVTTVMASDVYLDQPPNLGRAFKIVFSRFFPLIGAVFVWGLTWFIGFIFLIIPGLYFLARFFAVRPLVLLENASAGQALERSSTLSVDVKRHILNTLILAGLLVLALTVGGQMLFALIPSKILQQVMSLLLSSTLYPFFGITETLLYYDIRIRKEGFDVEYLAATMGLPSDDLAAAAGG